MLNNKQYINTFVNQYRNLELPWIIRKCNILSRELTKWCYLNKIEGSFNGVDVTYNILSSISLEASYY